MRDNRLKRRKQAITTAYTQKYGKQNIIDQDDDDQKENEYVRSIYDEQQSKKSKHKKPHVHTPANTIETIEMTDKKEEEQEQEQEEGDGLDLYLTASHNKPLESHQIINELQNDNLDDDDMLLKHEKKKQKQQNDDDNVDDNHDDVDVELNEDDINAAFNK